MPYRGAGIAPVFATVEGGYFREQGLEPELVSYQGHPVARGPDRRRGATSPMRSGPEVIWPTGAIGATP